MPYNIATRAAIYLNYVDRCVCTHRIRYKRCITRRITTHLVGRIIIQQLLYVYMYVQIFINLIYYNRGAQKMQRFNIYIYILQILKNFV